MKTSIDLISKPIILLIALGVLKGYIRGATGILIKALFAMSMHRKKVAADYSADFLKSAGFIYHLYLALQKSLSKDKAFEITRATVLCTALALMQANFRNVEEERTFENLIKYQQRTNQEGLTKLNTMEILEQSQNVYRFRMTKCMFYQFFKDAGAPELTSIMCAVDNMMFNVYLPNEVVFERGLKETIPEGANGCSFCLRKVVVDRTN